MISNEDPNNEQLPDFKWLFYIIFGIILIVISCVVYGIYEGIEYLIKNL